MFEHCFKKKVYKEKVEKKKFLNIKFQFEFERAYKSSTKKAISFFR